MIGSYKINHMEKVPESCHALKCYKAGELPVYELVPIKQPGDDEVLVKIDASVITHFENHIISGRFNLAVFPFIGGTQGVGHVVKAGKNGQGLIGKRVVGNGLSNFWAQYVTLNIKEVIEIDQSVSLTSAANGFINPFTAIGLIDEVKKQGRKSIVVDAAASALGRMINKLARKQNIPVLNVVRRKEQADLLKSEGAEHVVVTEGNWQQEYQALTNKLQSDILIDSLCVGEVFQSIYRGLIPGGIILAVGHLEGIPSIVVPGSQQSAEVEGYTFIGWNLYMWYKLRTYEDLKENYFNKHSSRLNNEFSTDLAQTFKFSEIEKAIEASKSNQTKGKILLVP